MWLSVTPKINKLVIGTKDLFVILQDQIIKLGAILIIQVHKSVQHWMDRLAFNLLQDGI